MGLCIKTPIAGTVKFINCTQECIDNNFRFKPEDGPGLIKGSATDEVDIDGVYWGGKYAREVWKIPSHVRIEITCDEECNVAKIKYCKNIAMEILFNYPVVRFRVGQSLPDATWPANNW